MEPRGARHPEACNGHIWGSKLEKDSEISDITHKRLKEIEIYTEEVQKWTSIQSG